MVGWSGVVDQRISPGTLYDDVERFCFYSYHMFLAQSHVVTFAQVPETAPHDRNPEP
jgi:hypothetical protein